MIFDMKRLKVATNSIGCWDEFHRAFKIPLNQNCFRLLINDTRDYSMEESYYKADRKFMTVQEINERTKRDLLRRERNANDEGTLLNYS